MKRYRIILTAALVLAVAGCSKDQILEQTPAEKYYIGAEITEVGSKTTRDDLSILWSEGDAIRIVSNKNLTGGVFTLEEGKGTKKGLFSGSTELSGDYYMALYPSTGSINSAYYCYSVPTTITYGQEFKDFPMASYESDTKTLNFKPLAAVVQLSLYDANIERNITEISINVKGGRSGFGNVKLGQDFFVSGKIKEYSVVSGSSSASIELPEGGVKIGNSAETATVFCFLIKPNGNQGNTTFEANDYYDMIDITVSSGTEVMHLYKTSPDSFSAGEIRRFSPVQFQTSEEKAVSVSIDGGAYVTLAKAISDAVYPGLSLKLKSNFPGNLVTKSDMTKVFTFIDNCSQPIKLDLSEISFSHNSTWVTFGDGQQKIKEFVCPNTLVTLESYSLRNCSNLEQITLNEGLEELSGLGGTPKITTFNIPSTVKVITPSFNTGTEFTVTAGNNTFFAIDGILYKWTNSKHTQKMLYTYPKRNTRTSFTVPLTDSYNGYLFSGAQYLEEIIFPYSKNTIQLGGSDFNNVPNLHTLKFYSNVKTNSAKEVGGNVPAGQAKTIYVPTALLSTFETYSWIQTLVNTCGFTLTGGADSYPESKSSIVGLGTASSPSNEWK